MMIGKEKALGLITVVLLLCSLTALKAQDTDEGNASALAEKIFNESLQLRNQYPDSSIVLLQEAHEAFLKNGDTLQAIKALLIMPFQYGQKVDYAMSYDGLWLGLLLADELDNDALKASIYGRLGRLYSFFKKEEQAFEYLRTALQINKELVSQGSLDESNLVQNYYLICATYRELGKPELGKVYLDSCLLRYTDFPGQIDMSYLQFEKAFILSQEEKNEEALKILSEVEPWFLSNRPSYLVLVYTYWGDVYSNLSDLQKSEDYYQKALEISDKYNSHLDFSPLVHERLANLYLKKGDYQTAYASQKMAKELDAQFFDSRSPNNRPLLEIKDEFRLEKERQEKLIQKQRLEQLEQQDEILLLQRVILSGTIIFLLAIGLIYLKYIRSKHKAEKQLIRRNKEFEIQKAEELLELKNKELAASALQLVEKDEFLKEIKSRLKGENGNIRTAEINKVLKSISHSNQSNWEEFKLRFTAVNEKFYHQVTTKYPNLSQADQKICALIKLNFSSKEMARLLGISVESVHTTRYRLRKKMQLDRSVNLEDFIASI
jgi:tetratricopeptide (TPR) repeat protein/DNA-binding CsgD family transcriptional regulator